MALHPRGRETQLIVKVTEFISISATQKKFVSPMLRKIVRFKCSTNLSCAILMLYRHECKTHLLVRVADFYRDKV